ncbi:M14 family zinc carboxypeptidase [Natrarchaeobius chitinivorans]|uniref:Peptidase M14 domain-containing protein n=1 Tax=Natrarchaeobius chitinivorans TaxID=1679083 RepID=A0A3N6M7K2_NATCH|nr:M14 family zinc carboxypeptidase [Natrarchaeobius chitinivorans]RQG89356.1 hypothetical protein EA473_22385 [Natrarchaeobius chitinivorans]
MSDEHIAVELADPWWGPNGYWNFRLNGVKDKQISFHIRNIEESHQDLDYRPAITADPMTDEWDRVDEWVEDGWTHSFDIDTAYIGFVPYPYRKTVDFVSEVSDSEFVETAVIGQSVQGRDMHCIRIGDPTENGEMLDIVLTTRLHPGETLSSYQIEGAVNYILDTFRESGFDRAYRFHIYPNGNPDGMVNGWQRHNVNGVNLNRQWDKTDPSVEVENIQHDLESHVDNYHWGIDWHTQPADYPTVFYDATEHSDDEIDTIEEIERAIEGTSGLNSVDGAGRARGYFTDEFGGPGITIETKDYHPYDAATLRSEGRQVIQAITDTAA